MNKIVVLPSWLKDGVKPLKNSFPKKANLLVFDTETESEISGDPYLLTFYDGNKPNYIRVKPDNITVEFMKYLLDHCPKRYSNILFAHNLEFDLGAVLSDRTEDVFKWRKPPAIEVINKAQKLGEISLFPDKTWFAQIKLNNGANVKAVDSANFLRGSLYNLSRELNLKHKKETRPKWIGRRPLNKSEWKELIRYCGAEIKAEYALAEYLLDLHKKYEIGYTVSIAHLCSKIFRKYFLKTSIPQTLYPVRKLAEFCIHGGRAECFVKSPVVIPNVKMYDYNSFYPWAMTKLPPITEGEWVQTNVFSEDYEGFYLVNGYVSECKWPLVLKSSKGFTFAKNENIRNVPIVSYELKEALRSKELTLERVDGWIWVPSENSVNPFKNFVTEFYDKKELRRNDRSLYLQYKMILNSLYGKTYQALRMTGYDEEPELVWDQRKGYAKKNRILYRAGGLYLPHVGAWITSLSRAKLHEDMHRFEAIDCATDSFKTLKNVHTGEALGDLKFVAEGLLLMVRPKLYVMFSKELAEKIEQFGDLREYLKNIDISSLSYPEDIVKYALHGFWGSVYQLLELYRDKSNKYLCKHMTRIRESLRQHKNARVFETQTRGIRVNWKNEVGFCGLKKGVASRTLELCSDQCFNCPYT